MKYRSKDGKKLRGSGSRRRANQLYVMPTNGGWVVKRGSGDSPTTVHPTQTAATKAAKDSLRTQGSGELRIQGRNGRFRESFVFSRSDFERISAIEGLTHSTEIEHDFDEFDRRGQTDYQRRKKIMHKYSKRRV